MKLIYIMKKIIKKIIYFKKLIDSYDGIYCGWEVVYDNKKIAELDFTDTRCGREHIYDIININIELNDLEIKEVFELKAIYRNKYFQSICLKPEVDFFCFYYPEFNKLGSQYLRIYYHKDVDYNKFYKIVIELIYFYRLFFPNKRDKRLKVNCKNIKS